MDFKYSDIKKNGYSYLGSSLFKNSFFLALTRVFNAGCGFIFWMIATRLYSIEAVGIATALVSSLSIVTYLSRLGLDESLVRYFPISDKDKVMNSCLIMTTISSAIVGVLYVAGINIFSPTLSFLRNIQYALIFLTVVIFNSTALTTGNSTVAIREAKNYFYQNVILATRIPLLFPFVAFGSIGIYATLGLANISCTIYSFLHLNKKIKFELKFDKRFIEQSFKFSFGNYISGLLKNIPDYVLPIMILNMLGGAEAARFFIAYSIGLLVLIIPDSLSTSLFVEGSHGGNLKESVIKVVSTIFLLLIPSVTLIYFSGGYILQIFGKGYIEAFELLRLLALSSFLVTIHSVFIPVQNIRMQVKSIVIFNFIRFVLLLGGSYMLIREYGIVGVGYAWLITYALLSFGIISLAKREKWI